MTTIKIPTPLRAYTDGNAEIKVEGETVGAALGDLVTKHPDLRQHIYNGNELRNFVNVFIGEEDIRYPDGLETPPEPRDNLRIIPSIAGGTRSGPKGAAISVIERISPDEGPPSHDEIRRYTPHLIIPG